MDATAYRKNSIERIGCSILLITILLCAVFVRNAVWNSEISLWSDVVNRAPHLPRGYNNLGTAYGLSGLSDKAVEEFRKALDTRSAYEAQGDSRHDSDYARSHFNIAVALADKGLIDEAIEHYLLAVELAPRYAEAYDNLGAAYGRKGLADLAIDLHRKALEIDPDLATAHFNLGVVFLFKGEREKAREEFTAALRIAPEDAQSRMFLRSLSSGRKF